MLGGLEPLNTSSASGFYFQKTRFAGGSESKIHFLLFTDGRNKRMHFRFWYLSPEVLVDEFYRYDQIDV